MGKEISSVFLPYVSVIISSNINEVIRAVLNPLFIFFYKKISHAPKAPKTPKAQRRNQARAHSANKGTKIKNVLKNI